MTDVCGKADAISLRMRSAAVGIGNLIGLRASPADAEVDAYRCLPDVFAEPPSLIFSVVRTVEQLGVTIVPRKAWMVSPG